MLNNVNRLFLFTSACNVAKCLFNSVQLYKYNSAIFVILIDRNNGRSGYDFGSLSI